MGSFLVGGSQNRCCRPLELYSVWYFSHKKCHFSCRLEAKTNYLASARMMPMSIIIFRRLLEPALSPLRIDKGSRFCAVHSRRCNHKYNEEGDTRGEDETSKQ